MYAVTLAEFSGPLDLLLHIIEKDELDITKVSLAQVAEQYLQYVNSLTEVQPEEVADFLVIASRLLYIKSKVLLPTLDLEEDGVDLEKQLRMYKEFVEASKHLAEQLSRNQHCYVKTAYPVVLDEGFTPPTGFTLEKCQKYFEQVIKKLTPLILLPKKLIEKTVTITEKIAHIKELILSQSKISFHEMIAGAENKTEKIVSFLAMLELVKQKTVQVEQSDLFHDITITNPKV